MPVYEYKCKNGHTFERVLKLSEFTEEFPCPNCPNRLDREYRRVHAKLVPSVPAPAVFKRGVGGFYKPSD